MIETIIKKYKGIILYGIFGVCTTLINILLYYLLYSIIGISNFISTVIALIVAVLFAFVTNKFYVFNSKSIEKKVLIYEAASFFACRGITGLIDVVTMVVTVDYMHLNSTYCKIGSNIVVIILNYIVSKLIVFKNARRNH